MKKIEKLTVVSSVIFFGLLQEASANYSDVCSHCEVAHHDCISVCNRPENLKNTSDCYQNCGKILNDCMTNCQSK